MKKENRLLTIDGETLMSQPLTPLNFVVDTLLSQGLHILAGSPKVGKSWLALWLAVTVAKGEAVWGMGVKQGTTLYLCLEDSTLRIQNRLFEITEDAPAHAALRRHVPAAPQRAGGTNRAILEGASADQAHRHRHAPAHPHSRQ